MTTYRYISADNHLDLKWMPPDLWQARVPAKYRDRAPKVVDEDGKKMWTWEGNLHGPSASGDDNIGELQESAFGKSGVELQPGSLPPSDSEILLAHMDLAHIWSHMIYGPTRKQRFNDLELDLICNQAYNDFLLELNSAAPERIVGLPNVPNKAPETCVDEVRRLAETGIKGVEFSIYTAAEPVWSPVWEPLWSLLEEAGIVLGFHIGAAAGEPYPPNEFGRYPAHFCYSPFATQTAMAQIIFSGALDRHPDLKVVFAECRVGWLPFFIEHMDRQARERPTDVPLSLQPSEYWQRQVAATFEDDVVGAKLLKEDWSHLKGTVMWGADYPHNPVSWPNTDELMGWLMEGVEPDVVHDAVYGRAADFYKITPPADGVDRP